MTVDEVPTRDLLAWWLRTILEKDLRLAKGCPKGPWEWYDRGHSASLQSEPTEDEYVVHVLDVDQSPRDGHGFITDRPELRHIAQHDPQDVIARCEADLAVLKWHQPVNTGTRGRLDCLICCPPDYEHGRHIYEDWPCRTIRLLAWGYRHRDGYPEVAGDWTP